MKTLEEVKQILAKHRFDVFHDYDLRVDYIHYLGLYGETLEMLKEQIGEGWLFEVVNHIEDTDWYRVHIKPA